MKKLITTLIVLTSVSAIAQTNPQWIKLAGNSSVDYLIQSDSFKITKEKDIEILGVTVQTLDKPTNKITYNNMLLVSKSCNAKQGKLVRFNIDGKNPVSSDFVLNGTDIDSIYATTICNTYKNKDNPVQGNPEDMWARITFSDNSDISVKTDSLAKAKLSNGQDGFLMTGRNIDKKTKKITLVNWTISKQDCIKKQGTLNTFDINGKYSYDNNFVFGAGSMGSIIAETICGSK